MDAGGILATIGVFAVFVKGLVDAIRRQWPRVDGLWVQVVAVVIGAAAAAVFDLQGTAVLLEAAGAGAARVPAVPIDYVLTGAAIGLGSGFLAELSGRRTVPVVEVDAGGKPV